MFNGTIYDENPHPVGAEERRKKIDLDVQRFLENGGKIQQIAHDVFGDKSVNLTQRQREIYNGRTPKKKTKDQR